MKNSVEPPSDSLTPSQPGPFIKRKHQCELKKASPGTPASPAYAPGSSTDENIPLKRKRIDEPVSDGSSHDQLEAHRRRKRRSSPEFPAEDTPTKKKQLFEPASYATSRDEPDFPADCRGDNMLNVKQNQSAKKTNQSHTMQGNPKSELITTSPGDPAPFRGSSSGSQGEIIPSKRKHSAEPTVDNLMTHDEPGLFTKRICSHRLSTVMEKIPTTNGNQQFYSQRVRGGWRILNAAEAAEKLPKSKKKIQFKEQEQWKNSADYHQAETTSPAPTPASRSQTKHAGRRTCYLRFIASVSEDKKWKPWENRCLLKAVEKGEEFPVMSDHLSHGLVLRSEEDCREQVASLRAKKEQERERRQAEIAQEQGLRQNELRHEPNLKRLHDRVQNWKHIEDDDDMKLVIWKYYQLQGILDPSVIDSHEGLRKSLKTRFANDISPQFLGFAARQFLLRRADKSGTGR